MPATLEGVVRNELRERRKGAGAQQKSNGDLAAQQAAFIKATDAVARARLATGATKSTPSAGLHPGAPPRGAAAADDRRRQAEQLRVHLDDAVRRDLETLPQERQMLVLLGLQHQMASIRRAADLEHQKLLKLEEAATEADKRERAKLAMFRSRTDGELASELAGAVKNAVARQKELNRAYEGNVASRRSTFFLSLALTAAIAVAVIASGWLLAQGNNVYRLHKAFYWVAETVWPSRSRGTLFMEGQSDSQRRFSDEYDYYK